MHRSPFCRLQDAVNFIYIYVNINKACTVMLYLIVFLFSLPTCTVKGK